MNKNIYMLWLQGFSAAPDLVKRCVKRCQELNSKTWKMHLLDETTLKKYINTDINSKSPLKFAHRADIYRLRLLRKHGGLWMDATIFCLKPLDEWLPKVTSAGLFMFRNTKNNISNWFIYTEKGHPIISRLLKKLTVYRTLNSNTSRYYIFHQLFKVMIRGNIRLKGLLDRMPKISSNNCHYLVSRNNGKLNSYNDVNPKFLAKIRDSQVFKLSRDIDNEQITKNSCLQYLYNL